MRLPLALLVLAASCGGPDRDRVAPDGGIAAPADTGTVDDRWVHPEASTSAPADGPDAAESVAAQDAAVEVPPGSAAASCASVAATFCQKMQTCAPLFLEFIWRDQATCLERLRASCEYDQRARDSGLTGQALATCLSALDTTSCPDFFSRKLTACWPSGQRPDGNRCGSHRQCESGYCAVEAECGYCAPRSAAGQPCPSQDACLPGLFCLAGVCVKPGGPGQPCDTQSPCDLDLHCRNGACQPAGQAGDACTGNSCSYWKGVFCNAAIGKCQRYVRAAEGEACGVVPAGYAVCVPGDRCLGATATGTGTCSGKSADGEACAGRGCIHPARCLDNVCRLPENARCP